MQEHAGKMDIYKCKAVDLKEMVEKQEKENKKLA